MATISTENLTCQSKKEYLCRRATVDLTLARRKRRRRCASSSSCSPCRLLRRMFHFGKACMTANCMQRMRDSVLSWRNWIHAACSTTRSSYLLPITARRYMNTEVLTTVNRCMMSLFMSHLLLMSRARVKARLSMRRFQPWILLRQCSLSSASKPIPYLRRN